MALLFICLLVPLAGCASHAKVDPNVNWDSQIGSYTYSQAVKELGRPDAVAESSAGTSAD